MEEVKDTGRDLFHKKNAGKNMIYGSEDDSDYDNESDSDESYQNRQERNAFNQQNAFGMNVFNSNPFPRVAYAKKAVRGGGLFGNQPNFGAYGQPQQEPEEDLTSIEKEKPPSSCFRIAI
jgi:hypothetical protein